MSKTMEGMATKKNLPQTLTRLKQHLNSGAYEGDTSEGLVRHVTRQCARADG